MTSDAREIDQRIQDALAPLQAKVKELERKLLGATSMERFDQEASEIRANLTARSDIDMSGCYLDVMHPNQYEPNRFSLAALQQVARHSARQIDGSSFIHAQEGAEIERRNQGIRSFAQWSVRSGRTVFDFWEFRSSGLLFAARRMWEAFEEQSPGAAPYIAPRSIVQRVVSGVDTLTRAYARLEVPTDEEITFKMSLVGTDGRILHSVRDGYIGPARVAHDDPITWAHTATLEAWSTDPIGIAAEACRHIYERFDWSPSIDRIIGDIEDIYPQQR